MTRQLTSATEDYLKVIYKLTSENRRASTNQIAEEMGVTPASATGMVQKMARSDPALVEYQKHQGVRLTPPGENAALEVIRHHRLLELFLNQALGYPWDQVHSEADRLEHVISEDFEERIAQVLGNPSHDPHGDPIPTKDFRIPQQSRLRLSQLRPPQQAEIERVENTQQDFLRFLSEIGLVPQAQLIVTQYSPFDENLHLRIAGSDKPVVIGYLITSQVYVRIINEIGESEAA